MTLEEMWDAGTEWATDNVIEPVTDWVEDKVDDVKDYATSVAYKNWVAENLGGPTRMTKELEEAGWKEGLDGIPYNTNLIYTADDWARDQANAAADARVQAAATGGSTGGSTGTTGSGSFLSQDLRQRTPSGTMYNPDISEYLNSGLFNYTGPGGVPEYTYGQGLRTDGADYGIWGTPTDVPNPYYWGQFGEGYTEPTGPADGAISLPPVDLPAGVSPTNNNPNVGTPTTNINVGGNNTGGGTVPYQSGILDWVGGVNEAGNVSQYNPSGMSFPPNETGIAGTQQYFPSGMSFPADETGIGNAIQGSGMGWTGGVNEAGNVSQYNPSGMSFPPNETGIFDTQQYLPSGMSFPPDESGIGDARPVIPTSPLTWVDTGNNYGLHPDRGITSISGEDFYDSTLSGEFRAQKNFLSEGIWANDYNLGRPDDDNFIDFVPSAGEDAFEGAPLYYAWMKEDEQGNKLDTEHGQVGNAHVVAQASDGTLYDHNTEKQIQMDDIASAEMGFDFNNVNSMGISSPPSVATQPVVATNPVTSKPFVNYGPPNMRR